MKKVILGLAVLGLMVSFASAASVSRIEDNGKINGAQSWVAQCSNGSRHVIYYKNGTWYHGSLGHMGDRYNSWSKEDVAKYACEELR